MARGEVAGDEERAPPKVRGEEAEDAESAQWRALPERRRLRVVGRADLADRRLVLAQELVSELERGAVVVLLRGLDLAFPTDFELLLGRAALEACLWKAERRGVEVDSRSCRCGPWI